MKKAIVCPNCGYTGLSKRAIKGNDAIEIILWLFFLIPGLIYSLWRSGSRYNTCPSCGSSNLVPIDTPNGAKLLEAQGKTAEQVRTEIRNTPMSFKMKLVIGVGSVWLFFMLLGFASDYLFKSPEAKAVPVRSHPVAVVFDVPSLLGKNIDQVKKALGTPDDDSEPSALQLSQGITMWDKSWQKDGMMLDIEYNPNTRTVKDIFVGPTGITNDTDRLLKSANLTENNPRYSLKFVEALKGGGYTGVTVTPKSN